LCDISVPKSVMNDVPSAPIGDFENTLSFPSEETSHGFLHHTIGTLNNAMCIPAITVLELLPVNCYLISGLRELYQFRAICL
jgi:hypothetical protein